VLTASGMREADRKTIEEFGIPGFTLMESAGRAAMEATVRRYGPLKGKTITIIAGKGNNGGDGFVVARTLLAHGATVRVLTIAPEGEHSPDAAHNLRLLRTLQEREPKGRLIMEQYKGLEHLQAFTGADLYFDALLGTGLTSSLRPPVLDLVHWLNEQPSPKIALDLPSGLHTDTGVVMGATVKADLTVTMAALKAGLLLGKGPQFAGQIETAEIGIPSSFLNGAVTGNEGVWMATDEAVRSWLPRRAHDAHKYSTGLALVVGGSPGLTGAPVMSSTAAARVGAGAVVCACPSAVQPLLATKLTEVMTLSLPASDDGIDSNGALETLEPRLNQAHALLVGPGLGRAPGTQHFIRSILSRSTPPAVIDADGLNALEGHTDLIREHAQGRWILTPHAGEFKRLAGNEADFSDRIQLARDYAQQWNCVLILKGLPSVVGCPDGTVFINGTGNPSLATAGTGDVLAGLCAGLLAQGISPVYAAVCALHLGGAAADRYAGRRDPRTMLAMDLLNELPFVTKERFN
jgi:ADP-dependent NAD(P)H-hydrate dehydratase / NAD(P)H-hydrate epimerase